ncbi:MAG: hypothetical protein ABIT01_00380, partial [Thermoanaerobaculia bacterium]
SAEGELAAILSDADEIPLMRANAATALGSATPSAVSGAATAALVRALEDAWSAVAARAARSLGTRRANGAADALAKTAAAPRDFVALSAALALLDVGDRRGPALTQALLQRPALRGDYRLEMASAILAGRRGASAEALAHLSNAIADRPDFSRARELRAGVLEKLGRPDEAKRDRELAVRFRH